MMTNMSGILSIRHSIMMNSVTTTSVRSTRRL